MKPATFELTDSFGSRLEEEEETVRPTIRTDADAEKGGVVDEVATPAVDPWALPELQADLAPSWSELTAGQKVRRLAIGVVKFVALTILLYAFVCSLSLLSSSFRLLGGRQVGRVFRESKVLSNPIAGLMLGVLSTVLVQSSSTSTSIVVSMVNADLLLVDQAVFIVMGANIGTSVTNTIVALFHAADREEFRRAFAAATVHDMYNWLTVGVLLPVELITAAVFGTGYLTWFSGELVNWLQLKNKGSSIDILKKLTKPLTSLLIQIDKKAIITLTQTNATNVTVAKHWCGSANQTRYWCPYLFNFDASDALIGLPLLVVALVILCGCLICIVKLLHSMLKGSIAKIVRNVVNADLPGRVGKYLTGYGVIGIGAVMTFLVQSSSIFTSTLTPLVAVGILTLDRCYPLTLGSNIGTTGTAIIAALASDNLRNPLQIALCHLMFNITGILIWYPIPFMRRGPILLAQHLGNTTAKYGWFAVVYLIGMFLLLPAAVFGLSFAGILAIASVGGLLAILSICVITLNLLQTRAPNSLPPALRSWEFFPEFLHNLQPYDRQVRKMRRMCGRDQRVADSGADGAVDGNIVMSDFSGPSTKF